MVGKTPPTRSIEGPPERQTLGVSIETRKTPDPERIVHVLHSSTVIETAGNDQLDQSAPLAPVRVTAPLRRRQLVPKVIESRRLARITNAQLVTPRPQHVVDACPLHRRVALVLIVLRVEIAAENDVGIRIVAQDLVHSCPQRAGILNAGLLGHWITGTGLPVVGEDMEGGAIDLQLRLQDRTGVLNRMQAHGANGKAGEHHAFDSHPAARAGSGRCLT